MPTQLCTHLRITGQRCGSPALRDGVLCFYHQRAAIHHQIDLGDPAGYRAHLDAVPNDSKDPLSAEYFSVGPSARLTLDFPHLEDRASVQVAISTVLSALAQNRLTYRRAGILLYGLQIASANAKSIEQHTPPPPEINTLEATSTE